MFTVSYSHYKNELVKQAIDSLTYPCIECISIEKMVSGCSSNEVSLHQCDAVKQFISVMGSRALLMTADELQALRFNNPNSIRAKIEEKIQFIETVRR